MKILTQRSLRENEMRLKQGPQKTQLMIPMKESTNTTAKSCVYYQGLILKRQTINLQRPWVYQGSINHSMNLRAPACK